MAAEMSTGAPIIRHRRSSAGAAAMAAGRRPSRPSAVEIVDEGSYGIFKHGVALLGYSLQLSLVGVLQIIALAALPWEQPREQQPAPGGGSLGALAPGAPRFNDQTHLWGYVVPFMFVASFMGACNISQSASNPRCGPAVAWPITFLRAGVLPALVFGGIAALLTYHFGVSLKFYTLDIAVLVVFCVAHVLIEVTKREQHYERTIGMAPTKSLGRRLSKRLSDAILPAAFVKQDDSPTEREGGEKTKTNMAAIASTIWVSLAIIFVLTLYPSVAIPWFMNSTPAARMVMVLVLHPIAYELTDALMRSADISLSTGTKSSPTKMMDGTFEDKQAQFLFIQIMACFRRFLLLNIGDRRLTIYAIVLTGGEEAATRACMPLIDAAIRKKRGQEKLKGDALDLQKVAWMNTINLQMIAEFNAIILSSVAYIVFAKHRYIFNFGYGNVEKDVLGGGLVFIQLLLELGTEILVDHVAMRMENYSHDIPVTRYFSWLKSAANTGYHIGVLMIALFFVVNAFQSVPVAIWGCENADPCACLESEALRHLSALCTHPTNTSNVDDWRLNVGIDAADIFKDVDSTTIVLAVIATTVIVISLFAVHERKTKFLAERKVSALHKSVKGVKRKMAAMSHELKLSKQQQQQVEAAMKELNERVHGIGRFQIPYKEIFREKKLGSGSFGDVWLATYTHVHVSAPVAVKKLKAERIDKFMLRKFQDEIELMARLEHENIVGFVGMVWEEPNLCIVLEFVSGGSLSDALTDDHKSPEPRLTWERYKLHIATGVASAIQYLHALQPKVIHRDIKSDNVLLTEGDLTAKLADFGESRELEQDGASTMTFVGTPYYLAPEVARGEQYDEKCDVYGFGVLLLEMASAGGLREAFGGMAGMPLVGRIVAGWRPTVPPSINDGELALVGELVRECMVGKQRARPSIDNVLSQLNAISKDVSAWTTAASKVWSTEGAISAPRVDASRTKEEDVPDVGKQPDGDMAQEIVDLRLALEKETQRRLALEQRVTEYEEMKRISREIGSSSSAGSGRRRNGKAPQGGTHTLTGPPHGNPIRNAVPPAPYADDDR